MPKAHPLRLWLALRIVLAGILPLALVAVLVLGVLLPQQHADLEIHHRALAHAIAGSIETYLKGAERELRAMAEDIQDRKRPSSAFWFDHPSARVGPDEVFAAIYLIEADGSVSGPGLPLSPPDPGGKPVQLDPATWTVFRAARKLGRPWWAENFPSLVSGRPALSLVIPVGEGVLVGELGIDQIAQLISRLPAEHEGVTMILDPQNRIIAHSWSQGAGRPLSAGQPVKLEEVSPERSGYRSFELGGERFIGPQVAVLPLDWVVLVAQSGTEVFRPFLSTLWMLIVGALVALSLVALVAWVLARGLAWRIGRYASQAHALAEGDYDQLWPVSHILEFNHLADDLKRMALAIRQRELDLAASEARYRSLIANAPVVLFQFDDQGIFTLSEGKGLAGIGLASGEAVGQSVFELYRDYPHVCEYARRTLRGESVHFTTWIGDVFYDVYASPVRDAEGHLQVMGVTVDITERQRAEEALRQSRNLLQMVLDTIPTRVFWKDLELRYLGCNRSFALDAGLDSVEEMIGKDDYQMGWREQADLYRSDDRQVLESGQPKLDYEEWQTTPDGRHLWLQTSKVPLRDPDGLVLGILGTYQDITKRKQVENSLLASHALLDAISRAQSLYIKGADTNAIFDGMLSALLDVTESEYGFIGEVRREADGVPYLKTQAITNIAWDEATRAFYTANAPRGMEFRNPQTLFGAVITSGQPVFSADPSRDPRSGGTPPGHPPLRTFMGLPFFRGQELVGMVGVANRRGGYQEEMAKYLQPFLNTCASVTRAIQENQQRRRVEEALRASEARLRTAIESVPFDFFLIDADGRYVLQNTSSRKHWGDVVGKYPEEATEDAELLAHWQDNNRRAFAGEIVEEEVRHTLGEEERCIHNIIAPIKDKDETIGILGLNIDITDRKRAEQALQQSEAKFRRLHESMMDAFVSVDMNGVIREFNQVYQDMLGYSEEELPRLTYRDLTPEKWHAFEAGILQTQVFVQGYSEVYEKEYRRKEGTVFPVELRTYLLRNTSGEPAGMWAIVRDISDRKEAEKALADSELLLRESQKLSPVGSCEWEMATDKLYWSDEQFRIFGYEPGAIAPSYQAFLAALHADDKERVIAAVNQAVEGEAPYVTEYRILRPDGVERVIYAKGEVRRDRQGRPVRMIGSIIDITDQKQMEEALRKSEHQYRELVENANSIILRWNRRGEITFMNEFGLKFFGYSEQELLGQHVVGTIVPSDESSGRDLRPLMDEICHDPERFERNVNENQRRNGEQVWVAWTNKAVLDESGQVVEVFSVGSDITDRKRAEEELLRHREHLEELVAERTAELRQAMAQLMQSEKLAALGSLVAGVAHELNTPLGNTRTIAGALGEEVRAFAVSVDSGILRRSQLEAFINRSQEAVALLECNAARAADLIGHFKQVAVDQTSMRRRRFHLRRTVEEILATLQPQFKHTAHRYELDIPAELELDSYPGPLEQIIANLVTNSLAHGFAGLEAGRIRILARAKDRQQVVLTYLDNGLGIPSDTQNRIFEPFFTTGLGSGGSGLGLFIVYNLVTGVLGGTIQVQSHPGQGTNFTLTLPRIAPDRPALGMPT